MCMLGVSGAARTSLSCTPTHAKSGLDDSSGGEVRRPASGAEDEYRYTSSYLAFGGAWCWYRWDV